MNDYTLMIFLNMFFIYQSKICSIDDYDIFSLILSSIAICISITLLIF